MQNSNESNHMPDVTILMPCLNEEETIDYCINKAKEWIAKSNLEVEILIADNGSTDQSVNKALSGGARVVHVSQKGYGAALIEGIAAANSEFIVMGDADGSYDFSNLDLFIDGLKQGADLVIGNRFKGGIEPGAMPWKNKYIGNPVLSKIGRVLFKIKVRDFHCGLRALTKNAFNKMGLATTGMEFASEMVIKAAQKGLEIVEVPTTLSVDGRSRKPHLRPWRDGARHLQFMILLAPNWLFLTPGIILSIFSFFLYISLLGGPVEIGNLKLSYNTMFFSQTGITFGVLLILLGLIVRELNLKLGFNNKPSSFIKYRNKLPGFLLMFGSLIFIFGISFGIKLINFWGDLGFGEITNGKFLILVSNATLIISTGTLMITFSLLFAYLRIPNKYEDLGNS